MCKVDSQQEFAVWLGGLEKGVLCQSGGVGGNFKREGICVYLWLIRVEV